MTIENSIVYTIGGSGFIGRHLIIKLLKQGLKVVNIDPFEFNPQSSGYQQYQLSIDDCLKSIDKIMKPKSIVYYLASASVPGNENDIYFDYVKSVKPFLDFMDKVTPLEPKIIFSSSAGAVYGDNDKPAKESDFLNPKSPYGVHKLIIERYLHLYFIKHRIDYRIARISNPYGNNQEHNHGIGFIDVLLSTFQEKGEIKIYGELSNLRDFIHISDVVEALILISNFELIPPNKIVNISFGESITLQNVINLLQSKYGFNLKIVKVSEKKEHVKASLVNNEILKNIYGYMPKIFLKKFIEEML